jgi:hypothetical protein
VADDVAALAVRRHLVQPQNAFLPETRVARRASRSDVVRLDVNLHSLDG